MSWDFDISTRVTLDGSSREGIVQGVFFDGGAPAYLVRYWDAERRAQTQYFPADALQHAKRGDTGHADEHVHSERRQMSLRDWELSTRLPEEWHYEDNEDNEGEDEDTQDETSETGHYAE